MDTIFVKKYVAKGELPEANGWYTIKFNNTNEQSIEKLRFDISRKKFHNDDSEFDHVEYWLDEVLPSEYFKSVITTEWILGEGFVKKILNRYTKEEISFGKMVELFNERIQSHAGRFTESQVHISINQARGITFKGDGSHFYHNTNSEIIQSLIQQIKYNLK